MPGCAHIVGYIHMTIQTEVLTETLKDLSSDLHWWYCKFFPNQDHTVAVITHDESTAVFSCKGDSLEEYWNCILNALIYLEDDGKGHRSDLIVDDGGDMTIIIHNSKKVDGFFHKDGTISDPSIKTYSAIGGERRC